jgi:FADH2 O2-dependent halogenase
MSQEKYDVAVLGSGIAGSTLAAILGRQGFRVLLLEKGTHPRFAVGEAMQPQSSMLMWILGERFGAATVMVAVLPCRSIRTSTWCGSIAIATGGSTGPSSCARTRVTC